MPLPSPSQSRQAMHRRSFDVQVSFARADGLFDTKPRDIPLASAVRAAGESLHEMGLHLVIDRHLQNDKCQALRSDGPMVRTHYPRWYRGGSAHQAESQSLPASSSS